MIGGVSVTSEKAEGLLERSAQVAVLRRALEGARGRSRGRLLLVGGEAGAGKTALLRRFCDEHDRVGRILWGGCEGLFTPRPLGPLLDIAESTGREFEELVVSGARPHEVAAALLREIATRPPTILVLEDLHWADEATLDVLRLLARRIEALPVLVIASYRDDELRPDHPLVIVLGELATSRGIDRLAVPRLSAAAVAELAEPHGVDADELYRRTGGNPFFVTEALAAGEGEIPPTVRDAVLARAARLCPAARELLEAVAVVPPQVDLWLLEGLAGSATDQLGECLSAGMLRPTPTGVAYRHELARLAVEDSIAPNRKLALHRAALALLADPPSGGLDLDRLAHHADAAADADAVLRFAPASAARAASLGAHREAAAQYARALRFAGGLPPEARAELLERRSHECYVADLSGEAIEALERALECHRALEDRRKEGDALRALSAILWCPGRVADAQATGLEAVALLERFPPGRELAMAYANLAGLCMNAEDADGTIAWGTRALALADRLDDTQSAPTRSTASARCSSSGADRRRARRLSRASIWRSGSDARRTCCECSRTSPGRPRAIARTR